MWACCVVAGVMQTDGVSTPSAVLGVVLRPHVSGLRWEPSGCLSHRPAGSSEERYACDPE